MRSDKKSKMTDKTPHSMCFFDLGSVSSAIAAQKVLASAAIYAEVIKREGTTRSGGCAYGIEFSCQQANNVRAVLRSSNIRIRGSDGI